jgi:UDP:flavonoid glycosyltransferase YjiC (YdhE family)
MNMCIVLARELAERGHSVFFATQEEGISWLAHPGIRHVAWEPPWTGRNGESFLEHLRAVRGAMSEESDAHRRLALSARSAADVYAAAFDSLRRILPPIAPDVLIVPEVLGPGMDSGHDLGCRVILMARFLPNAVRRRPIEAMPDVRERPLWRRRLVSIPSIFGRKRAERRLERARRARSCSMSRIELLRRAIVLGCTDSAIEGTDAFIPTVRLVGPLIPDPLAPLPEPTLRWIEEQAPRGIVLAAFGTLVRLDRQLEALAEGLVDCGASVLWALPERQHDLVRNRSASFRVETFVPQATVLSRDEVRLFVTHAGANSALEAMYWGRPMLALPFMFDQHYYARRAVELTVGLQLEPHALTGRDVRNAVQRLLGEPRFSDGARSVAGRLRRTPGVKGAADLVEASLARHP